MIDLFVLGYLLAAVIRQRWNMFAPNPSTSDRRLRVFLRLQSGEALAWDPPRLETLTRWDAFRMFRHREYEIALLDGDPSRSCRAALAEYLLRKYDFADQPPTSVVFVCEDSPLADPASAATIVPRGVPGSAPGGEPETVVLDTYDPLHGLV